MSLKFVPALVQIMAWRRPGAKPLSEPMMFSSPMHICVTRPQWFKPMLTDWIISMIITRDPCWAYVMPFHTFNSMCPSDVIFRLKSGSALSDGTKPLVEPKFTNHQWSLVAFTWGHFHKKILNIALLDVDLKITILRLQPLLPGVNELMLWISFEDWVSLELIYGYPII